MLPRTAEQINGKLSTEVSRNGHAVRDQLRALQVAFRSHQAPAFPDATAAEAFLNQYAPHLDPKFEGNARIAYIKDYGGRYLFANRTWESVNGQPWFGKTDRELWPKPVASELRAIDARVLNENRVCQSLVTIDNNGCNRRWLTTEFPLDVDDQGDQLIGGVAIEIEHAQCAPAQLGPPGESRYDELLDRIPAGIYRASVDGTLLYANAALLRMLGCSSLPELTSPESVAGPPHRGEFHSLIQGCAGEVKGFETVWTRVDGTGLRTRESARAVKDANGRLLYVEGVVEELPLQTPSEISDIDRNRILEAIAGNAQLDTIFDHITHIAESEMPGVRCCVTLITGDRLTVRSRGSVPVAFGEAIEAAGLCQDCGNPAVVAKLGEPVVAGDIEVHPCWGGLRELAREYRLRSCTSVPLLSSTNRVMGTLDVYRQHTHAPDASEFEHIESLARLAAIAVEHHGRMERLDAQHVTIDPLTRLPNRSAFEANLETAISAVRPGDAQLAVFWIDLDRLTSINDNLGHRAGDTLLKLVAARLVASFPHAMHMCRAGGDEFAVLFSLPQTADAVDAISAQLLQTFRDPFSVDGHDFVVTCSVGLAVFPEDGASAASLLRNSDAAMYRAKAWGKNTVERYRRAINNTGRRLDLENELRRACAHNELELFYQPQVDMDRRIDGLEALLRWRHPKHGLLPPAEFLPIAEETGLIVDPIGEWVLRNASKQFVKWEPNANPGMRIAVNVSAAQVYRTDLAAMVSRVIEQTGIRPENVELELTESVLMHNLEESVRKVQAVRSLGVSIAIDDFGTGYSSLSYLRQLPVDTLKIDKSFLDDVESRSGAALIRAISTLAKDLGLRVVAEGVETESQMALLSGLGIEHVQGYLISKPVPASEATKLIH